MIVFFSTDWTLNDSLLTEVDNVITLHPQEIGYNGENVCLIATNELNEVIATSGCGEEEPLITERFIRIWAESGFPSQMDIETSELYLEDNQLPSPPIILETFVDKYNNVYGSQQACEEGERKADYQHFLDCEEFYNEHPTGGEHVSKVYPQFINCTFVNCDMPEAEQFSQEVDKLMDAQIEYWNDEYLANLEKEARKPLENWFEKKTHNLIKRKDLPKRVDWEMLVNSSHLIWNAGHLLGLGQDPNNIVIVEGQEAVKNLELFFKCMLSNNFATLSSFKIEEQLKRQNATK